MKKKTVMSLLAVMSASMMLMSAGAFAAETEGTTEAATEISTEAESESESEAEELEDGVYSACLLYTSHGNSWTGTTMEAL